MKKHLAGTGAGRFLYDLAQRKRLMSLAAGNPEQAAFIANVAIADRLIVRLCPPDGTFVDVGAHIGTIFSWVHAIDQSVTLVAFEPDPEKAASLRQRFPWCTVHNNAVGDSRGQVSFYVDNQSTARNSLARPDHADQTEITVEMVTLDHVLAQTVPSVIKIDVEGAEVAVLRGGDAIIKEHLPTIMFESTGTGTNALGHAPEDLWDWLSERDYLIFYPDRLAHDAPALRRDAFLDAHEYPRRTDNFFAVHSSKRTSVRDRARQILRI